MKVAHFNTYADGGAAVLMRRLDDALRKAGHDSSIRYRHGYLLLPGAERVEYCQSWLDRQRERLRYRAENLMLEPGVPSYYSRLQLHRPTPIPAKDASADIVHLHWTARWLDLPSFLESIPRKTPVIWTIHDMSPLAGGCFADFGCPSLSEGCRKCPLLKKPFDRILPRRELLRRQRALSGRRVIAVGNSAHTTRLIRKSLLFRDSAEIATIHPAINPKEWITHDKAQARRLLGIPPERFVMGFGAASLTDENKGFSRFLDVANKVADRRGNIDALVFGDGIASAGGGR